MNALILASSIGKIGHPFFIAFATLLAWFYAIIPNYAVAIGLLTVAVMLVVFPITRKSTRSMMKMQLLAPELKKIQAKYKASPGATVAEKQENRTKLNEEMMALYKENGVSPTGGCLPMFLQFPIFIVLYDTIKGLTHTTKSGALEPLYINHNSKLYHAISSSHGHLNAFGINMADSVRSHGLSWGSKIPLIVLILVAVGLQYIQIKQLSGRNPAAAAANPQMQQMQKVFPIIFLVIYISIPAGVNVYFIISNLFRIGQQEFMYRNDPHIKESMEKLKARSKTDSKVQEAKLALKEKGVGEKKSFRQRIAELAPPVDATPTKSANGNRQQSKNGSSQKNTKPATNSAPKSQPRAQNKKPRRPR